MELDTQRFDKANTYPTGHGYARRPAGVRPQAVLIHSTNNARPTAFVGEARYLFTSEAVSAHFLIGKSAQVGVVQFLDPATWAAWHSGDCAPNVYENATSVGIELHISVGEAPTPYQFATCADLVRELMQRFNIPADRIATHRAVAVPPGRKRDPEGWPEASFAGWRNTLSPTAPPASPPYTEASPLLGTPRATATQAVAFILARPHGEYDDADIRDSIVWTYWEVCVSVGIDPVLAVAQMIHETGALSSWWSQRPRRNPAGIGVTGRSVTQEEYVARPERYPSNAWVFAPDGKWRAGVSYRSWRENAIPDHIGRLLCYVVPLGGGTDIQKDLIAGAVATRPFPPAFRGSAPNLRQLGRAHNPKGAHGAGWASPGPAYGIALAKVANAICEVRV